MFRAVHLLAMELPSDDEQGPEIHAGPNLLEMTHKAIPDPPLKTPARKRLEFLEDAFLGLCISTVLTPYQSDIL